MTAPDPATVLGLAVALDLALGEPPGRAHPVAWIGAAIGAARARCAGRPPRTLRLAGAGITVAVVGGSALAAALVEQAALRAPTWLATILCAIALDLAFSIRMLLGSARAVGRSLEHGDLARARDRVAWLVSRPTDDLDAEHVASAAVETTSENLTDSVVAPLLAFALLGLPGAWAYRAANTADAMLGYRRGELEHLGKVAARLDDLLNWIPARLTGLAVVLGAPAGGSLASSWTAMVRDRGRTPSPNGGWTMAAMAGAIGRTLEKPGAHRLGAGPLPEARDVARAIRIAGAALAIATGAIGLGLAVA